MDIVEAVAALDGAPEIHTARLLILLSAFMDPDGTCSIEGLTKLAKLDFLLRYPVMLNRALLAKGKSTRELRLEDHERDSVESEMVRYRYGPWDHRYHEVINSLVARGLSTISIEGRTVVITLTSLGKEAANRLANDPLFEPYARRSSLLRRYFDFTATHLMNFIYDTFPEVVTLQSNKAIPT